MRQLLPLLMVIVAYALGHAGGYRLCKLRIKNKVKKMITNSHQFAMFGKDGAHEAFQDVLSEVTRL